VRDWISEMAAHTQRIQHAIDAGQHDNAWRLTHEFQDWCIERINTEHYPLDSAGTLLSAPQGFLVKVLLAEGKYRQALVHTMYEGVLDARNLKFYPKSIKSLFKKASFKETNPDVALLVYGRLKEQPLPFAQAFQVIQSAVASWT
jgi:hypothetical protein